MDQSVNATLKMIEQNGASLAKKAELCKHTRPDLIGETEEFYSSYRSLVERYDHLNEELYKNIPLEFQMQEPTHTPMEQKLGSNKTGLKGASLSPGSATSDISPKDGSDLSLSDSESDSSNSSGNAYFSLPANTVHKIERKLLFDSEDTDGQGNGNYGDLIGRIMSYEEELRASKLKLKLSEEETARLKDELERSESFMILAETLRGPLDTANQSVRMREVDLEVERTRTMELKGMADSADEMECQLKSAGEEISMLRSKLESESDKCLELLERFGKLENDILERDDEVKALKLMLANSEEKFLAENSHFKSTISSLSERNSFLDARVKELELHTESLEEKLKQCEAEKIEFQIFHDTLISEQQEEITQLRLELGDETEFVEIQNKQLDYIKFKYDMLEAKKDEMTAKISTLNADVSLLKSQIGQKEEHLRQEQTKNAELIAVSESLEKQVTEMRKIIAELEREVDKQRSELFAGAEEKREAIRQLCFSLEHYRSGYKQLCQAFVQHKRHIVIAS